MVEGSEAQKTCTKCGSHLAIDQFYVANKQRGYIMSACKHCTRREVQKRSREKYALTGKYYDESNKRRSYKWREKNPEAWHLVWRKAQLKRNYNLSFEEYERMVFEQNDRCALCGTTDKGREALKFWIVDHCHTSGRVRGLLCHKCNVRIGAYEGLTRDIGLDKVANYLLKSKE